MKSSVGHVRDLPTSGSATLADKEEKQPVTRKSSKNLTEAEKVQRDYRPWFPYGD